MERNYAAWAEAFTIFAKYDDSAYAGVSAEHDVIYAGPDPAVVSKEDTARLEELGWHVGVEIEDCFYHFV